MLAVVENLLAGGKKITPSTPDPLITVLICGVWQEHGEIVGGLVYPPITLRHAAGPCFAMYASRIRMPSASDEFRYS